MRSPFSRLRPIRKTARRKQRRQLRSELLERRLLLVGEVEVRFEFLDSGMTPVTTAAVGDDLTLRTFIQDTQAIPDGLLRAYFDVNYDSSLATAGTPITHGPFYNLAPAGDTLSPGLIDEVGGTDTDTVAPANPGDEFLLFTVPITADAMGTLTLTIDDAETPSRTITLFDLTQIAASQVTLVGETLEIFSGVMIMPNSGLVTTEAGGTDTFDVVLTSQPTANVSFSLTSSDPLEGTVSASSVTFTNANWNIPQTITVTGVDDFEDDGDTLYTVITGTTTSADAAFNGIELPDVTITNIDDDTAGVLVSPTAGLVTTEAGGTSTFDVRLTSQPTANVVIDLASNDITEGTPSTPSLTFTPANWNTIQTVTVTGVNDFIDDGDVIYAIVTDPASSTDPLYNNFAVADVSVTNTNDDAVGISVNPLSGLVTTEAGGIQTFTVRLNSEPSADVVIGISSSNTDEGTVSPDSLTFTPSNWDMLQVVTVTGVDDFFDDGDQNYSILTAAAVSGDAQYNGLDAADVSITNQDDDAIGIFIDPLGGLITTEVGGSDTFTIVLQSQPTANVTINLTVSDLTEGSIDVPSVTFTPANWNDPQTVTVTGVNDDIDDDIVGYTIVTAAATSTDPQYSGLDPSDVSVSNIDDDVAGITVVPTSGLVTNEGGGTAEFTVVLTSEPTSSVSINLVSSDAGEGTVSTGTLVFNAANWNSPQLVTITGVDDDADDGDVAYAILTTSAASSDPKYSNRNVPNVSVINVDDDVAGVLVAPTSGLVTTEAGGTATFTARLTAQPSSNVTISLASSNENEGTISSPSITFTPANWNTAQELTITGVDDDLDDGDVDYAIITGTTVSSDPTFDGLTVADVLVTNADDDSTGVNIDPVAGLITTESGQTASFEVSLGSQPTSNVVIGLSSSDTGEGTITVTELTFTPANWNTAQIVTVTGVDDDIDDGDVAYSIITAAAVSADPDYSDLDVADVSLSNQDDDTAGILIQPVTGLQTTEAGGTASFTIVLTSEPVADVTIDLASNDTTEGTVDQASVVFNAGNWDTPQTVTVTGVEDLIDDGDVNYLIVTSPAVSSDPVYSGLDAADVSATNLDDDVPGIAIVPTEGLVTSEDGQTAAFEIVLTTQPSANVSIDLNSSDVTEGTVSQSTVTFTPSNWDTPQSITVQGVNDDIVDGSVSLVIGTSAAVSTDPAFSGIDPPDVGVTNLDNDTATLSITPVSALEGTGGTETLFVFDVILSTGVASPLSVDFASSDGTAVAVDGDYIANSGTLNFAGNQGETQTITVRVAHDNVVEADETFSVALSNVSGIADELAQRILLPLGPATGTITNDDTSEVTIIGPAPTAEGTDAADTPFTFTVQLSNPVQGGFAIDYATNDETAQVADADYVDNDGVLTFVGTANEIHTIQVDVRADDRVEPDETFNVTLGSISGLAATAADDITVQTAPVSATIVNDDFPRLLLTDITANPVEGTGGSTTEYQFQVTLTDAVDDPNGFEVPFTIDDGTASAAAGDYIDNDGSLQFNGSAGETKLISVLVNHDAIVEGNETFSVTLGDLIGLDPSQTVIVPLDSLQAAINNDDVATLTLSATATSLVEGATFDFTTTLSAEVQDGFTIAYATVDGTAQAADGDFSPVNNVLTFTGTANEMQMFSVQSQQDAKVELDELFSVALGALSGLPAVAANAITISDAVDVTILNDDSATITLTPSAAVNEGSGNDANELVFDVTLSAPVQGGLSIGYQTVDGTATDVDDYVDNDGSLIFSGSAAETQSIRVAVNADSTVEADETLRVMLGQIADLLPGLESDVTIGTADADGTILNDDTATLSIVGPGTLDEGTGTGPTDFVFSVELSNAVQGGLMIAYQTNDGTATIADGDFSANNGALVFQGGAGETRTVTVRVAADERVEPDETFSVSLGAITGLPPSAAGDVSVLNATAVATIRNDDFPRLLLSDTTVSTIEGSDGNNTTEYQFELTLTDTVDDPDGFIVPVTIDDGTATAATGDYQDNDVMLQFSGTAGETKTISVLVNHDLIVEGDETFTVNAGQIQGLAPGQSVQIETPSLSATIEDDDTASVTLSAASIVITEGNTGTTSVQFDATLSAPVQAGFQLNYATNDGTASVADGDYVDNDGVLVFDGSANEVRTISVDVVGDQIAELDETFVVALGALSGLDPAVASRITLSGTPITATISNDDTASLVISGPGILNEGTGGATTPFDFTVTLNGAMASGFNVAFDTIEGTATLADNDFVANSGSLMFSGADGQSQTIRVLVNQDARVENDEIFQVQLGQVSGLSGGLENLLSVDTNPVGATIGNDDTATISLVADSSNALEIDGQHEVTVRLNVSGGGSLSEPVVVNVFARESGTASENDFTLATSTLTFPAGSIDGQTQTIRLTLTDDGISENAETIVLGIELAAGTLAAVTLGSITTHTVTVVDDSMDAEIQGRVWVDSNGDGSLNIGELTIPSVTVALTGTTLGGETIERETRTDNQGVYRFTGLPAGTYSIVETQPDAFHDGIEVLGNVGGNETGVLGNDQFTEIDLGPSDVASGFHFGESGLRSPLVNRFRILSRPRVTSLYGAPLTAAMINGNVASTANAQTSLSVGGSTSEGSASAVMTPPPTSSSAEGEVAQNDAIADQLVRVLANPRPIASSATTDEALRLEDQWQGIIF